MFTSDIVISVPHNLTKEEAVRRVHERLVPKWERMLSDRRRKPIQEWNEDGSVGSVKFYAPRIPLAFSGRVIVSETRIHITARFPFSFFIKDIIGEVVAQVMRVEVEDIFGSLCGQCAGCVCQSPRRR